MHTMTKRQGKSGTIDIKAVLAEDQEFLRALVRMALQEVLEAEMTEALGAEKGERAVGRQGYRSGYYGRTLITRVGKLELRVPQDPTGRFSTELFERYQRSERALAEMYVQGVSTRKVKAITEELCGHSFSPLTATRHCNPPFREELTNNSIDILANFTLGPVLNYSRCARKTSRGSERYSKKSLPSPQFV
jgi:transposase-like protein